ncbi:MAG: NUDIX hydrolase [Phycisphaeraceae bacterium]|nr:NUDIX hydrolase [Phycisphaeraceae bacterium]
MARMSKLPFDDSVKVLEGARFDVYRIELPRRDGSTKPREVVVPPNAAVILPVMDNGDVVLIRNHRFAVGKTLYEIPAGTLELGEDPDIAAGRELEEETGYAAKQIRRLCQFYPSPGFCTEYMYVYLAEKLTFQGQKLDETERIEVAVTPWSEAMSMIRDGRIIDGKTIATLLYYQTFVKDAQA